MGWEHRRNGKYFYRTRRVNGHVVKEYLGSGAEAKEAARRVEAKRPALNEVERARRAEFDKLEVMFAILDVCIDVLMELDKRSPGYRRHDRGPWRKKRGNNMTNTENQEPISVPPPTDTDREAIQQVIQRASEGDYSAVQPLRTFINTRPGGAMALGGDVSWESLLLQVRNYAEWTSLSARPSSVGSTSPRGTQRHNPSPRGIERLLIENVLSTWLHLYCLETLYANQEKPSLESDNRFQKSLTAAQQRYLAAIKELARVRKWQCHRCKSTSREQVNVAGT